jgi:predicted dehydrogenase
MPKLRVGIIGAGFAARYHVECLRRVYGVDLEIAGVTSLRAESRKEFGQKRGIRVFDSLKDMLPHVDILDVCSPPYVHEDAILAAAAAGKGVICEKPFTGYFGPPGAVKSWRGDRAQKKEVLDRVIDRLRIIAEAVRKSGVILGYAENFVYAPSIQKEREIIEKTKAQVLRMTGEESHNGSASNVYGIWRFQGGGSFIGKGCHPLTGMLYLKRVEGLARNGKPIRPKAVSARAHQLTRLPNYEDRGFIRTEYYDAEDCGIMHVTFEDGTIADVLTSEVVLGGLYDYVEVFANNHRTRCRISPTGIVDTFNPKGEQFKDIYLIEKTSTQEGWAPAAPDEDFTTGHQAEMQEFISCAAKREEPQSGLDLALDTTAVIYAAYLSDEKKGEEVETPRV